jgi:putative ABC transport system ATP-binding protein
MIIAQLNGAGKTYQAGGSELIALHPTDLAINTGELLLIIGPSGSGKTTLLSMLGCVIKPTQGSVMVNEQQLNTLNGDQLAKLRLNTIGFVFQQFNLLAPLTALNNVEMPLMLQGLPARTARERALTALEKVGMSASKNQKPSQMSGGQQQRVAIARALVTEPRLVLCDEPTASLDSASMVIVMKELQDLARSGKAVAVVTHDPRLRPYADRAVQVENGQVTILDLNAPNALSTH